MRLRRFRQHNCFVHLPSPNATHFSMKIHFVLVFTAIFALPLLTSFTKIESRIGNAPRTAQQMVAAGYKRYGVEKGTLVFQYTGVSSGTDYIYFDNWGWREAKYSRCTTKLGTFSEETNAVQYLDGESRYIYQPASNKAKYFDSRQAVIIAEKNGTKDLSLYSDEMLRGMGGKQNGKVKIQNIDCDVWNIESQNVKLFMWKGITMGEESYVSGNLIGRKLMRVELDKNPPAEKLVLPKGAVVEGKK